MKKYLFIDMDGTIAEFYDISGKIHLQGFPKGFFLNKAPLLSIIKVLQTHYKDFEQIIISASPSPESDDEKNKWLDKYFNIQNRILLRYQNCDKAQSIFRFMQLNNITPDQVYIVDDDLRILNNCEKLGIHCIHPSHLLAQYESSTIN